MKIDGRVKGGLAWAGLFVILAVPAADMLFGKPTGNSAAIATTADAPAATGAKAPALKPAAATDPVKTAGVDGGQAVDKYLKSGKKLPSYISDADDVQPVAATAPASTPATVKQPAAVTAPTAVASVPAETPPIPLPRSARPKTTQVASLPTNEDPLIIDGPTANAPSQQADVERFPMSDEGQAQGQVVTGDQLEEWDSGSLADYLERKGLMSQDQPKASGNYDADGFYLDEGPNRRPVKRNLDFFLF